MVMPSSTITRYDLSMPFTEFSLMMNQRGYIGPQVLRPRLVGVQSADVGKIPLKQLLLQRDTKRAAGGGYKRDDFEMDKYSYATEDYGREAALDDRTLKIYADIIDAETTYAQRTAGFVCDGYERDVASAVYDTSVWTGSSLTTAAAALWSSWATATPITDVGNAKQKVRTNTGLEPNALICNALQYWNMINTAQVVDRLKYTARADQQTLANAVADVLGVRKVLVAGGLTNTANAQQAASISRIWSDSYVMVARVAETDDPQEPCVGRTFIWSGDGPGSVGTDETLALITEEYREEGVRGGVIRVRNDRDIRIMYSSAGHLINTVL